MIWKLVLLHEKGLDTPALDKENLKKWFLKYVIIPNNFFFNTLSDNLTILRVKPSSIGLGIDLETQCLCFTTKDEKVHKY